MDWFRGVCSLVTEIIRLYFLSIYLMKLMSGLELDVCVGGKKNHGNL